MKTLLFVFAIILFTACSGSDNTEQESTKIKGQATLTDGADVPVEVFVYYDRYNVSEEMLIKKVEADKNGKFEFEMPVGINYAEIHVAAPGYAAYETKYISGDKEPFLEATLSKTGIPQEVDSVDLYLQGKTERFEPMQKIDENTFVWEGTLDTTQIAYQPIIGQSFSQYDNSNETEWQYDHGGDYLNVLKSDDKQFKITIDLTKFRRYDKPKERKLTDGKWVNSPINKQYSEILESLQREQISRFAPNYYYLVQRGNDAVLGNMSEEQIQEAAAEVMESLNSYKKTADSLLAIIESPYLRDYLLLTKLQLMDITDSASYEDKIAVIDSLQEVPVTFASDVVGIIYDDKFKEDPEKNVNYLRDVFLRSEDEMNRNYLNFTLLSYLERSDLSKNNEFTEMIIEESRRIMVSDKVDSWIKESAPKLIKKLEIDNLEYAPDFKFTDVNGNEHSLSDFKGKWVLLDFWGVWCGPCRGETPYLVNTYEKFKNQGFEIISISTDRSVETVTDYMKEHNMNWINTIELEGYSDGVVELYGVNSFPTLFLISPDGKFDRTAEGKLRGDELEKTISEKVGEAS